MLESTRDKAMAGEKVRIGIMGGTFDPIHYGHLAAAHAAMEQLDLDEIMFLPAGTPAFKRDREITDGETRFEMCCAAVDNVPEFSVNVMEVMRPGVTYTADTLRQLSRSKHPSLEYVFIMGADSASTLLRWNDQEALRTMASYAVVTRSTQQIPAETLKELRDAGFKVETIETQTPLISSTEIRRRVMVGEDISRLVPPEVERIIVARSLYLGLDDPENPLSDAFFEARKADLKERVNEHRYQHSLGVADTAARLAEIYGANVRKARLAGILHDWDKGYDDKGIRQRADELGMTVDPQVYYALPRVLHAHTAPVAIKRLFPQVPEDVLTAMDRHTVAAENMLDLDMVVYIADALEPGRSFERADAMREKIGVVSLEELFFDVYEYWIMHMMERKMQLHPNTVGIWNYYVRRIRQREKEN